MSGIVQLYWHYFSWQRTMKITTLIGIGLLLLGAVVTHPIRGLPILLGLVLALVFPTAFAGLAYRLLIANKRLLLVPELRTAAGAALMLLAATGGLAAGLFTALLLGKPELAGTTGLVVFGLVSAHLLATQWLTTVTLGPLLSFVAPLLLCHVTVRTGLLLNPDLGTQWPIPLLAAVGWGCLIAGSRNAPPPRPPGAVPELPSPPGRSLEVRTSFARTSPGGTLLRGAPDDWFGRLIGTLLFVGSFVATILVVLLIVRRIDGDTRMVSLAGQLLICSFLGLLAHLPARTADWPARLRLLWLRAAGDRRSAWRMIEKALLEDTAIIVLVAGVLATGSYWLTDVSRTWLIVYVFACVAANLLYAYLALFGRTRGWPASFPQIAVGLPVLFGLLAFALQQAGTIRIPVAWLVVVLAVLVPAFRLLARRSIVRVDLCALRPARR